MRLIKDPISKELLLKDISEAFDIRQSTLNQKLRLTSQKDAPLATPGSHLDTHQEERYLLALALRSEHDYYLLAQELTED